MTVEYKDKDAIAQEVRDRVLKLWPDTQDTPFGSCMHHTLVGAVVLAEHGIQVGMQAGSVSWPIIDMAKDDGVQNTHFSMMWEPTHPSSMMSLMNGGIPELHSWLGIATTQTIIDFSTYQLKKVAKSTANLEWEGEDPPDYLWCGCDEIPEHVHYSPEIGCMQFVNDTLPKLWATRQVEDNNEERSEENTDE